MPARRSGAAVAAARARAAGFARRLASLFSSNNPTPERPRTLLCWRKWRPPMSRKVLLVTGDGGNSFEALYAYQRFLEERWEPVIAAPSRRRLHLIQHDFEPGWETYIERPG